MDLAKEHIKMAAEFSKVDVIKFQKRTPKELLSEEEYNSPHPNPHNSYGKTYGEHREFLEFDLEQHRELKEYCEQWGVIYSTSVWDMTSAKEIVSLDPEMIKIPSACNLKFDMLGYLCEEFKGEIHMSVGMTTQDEEVKILRFFEEKGKNKDLVLYSCTSGYPVPFEDISLKEIIRIKDKFEDKVKAIGFSGHHLGIAADIAALAYGATYFERHFTLDRTWKGTDHSASLEPDGMRRLARDLRNVNKALTYKQKEILDIEAVQRDKLKRF
jgi:N-acetylneuraminate synthase